MRGDGHHTGQVLEAPLAVHPHLDVYLFYGERTNNVLFELYFVASWLTYLAQAAVSMTNLEYARKLILGTDL